MNSRRRLPLLTACALAAACAQATAADPGVKSRQAEAKVSACFSPDEDCASRIVAAIDDAKESVHTMAYIISQDDIQKALIAAHARGVEVAIIADYDVDEKAEAKDCAEGKKIKTGTRELYDAKVPIMLDDSVKNAHNKISIIDGNLVIGGSFNYTESADRRNAENVTFITSREVAKWFEEDFATRAKNAKPYEPESCDKD